MSLNPKTLATAFGFTMASLTSTAAASDNTLHLCTSLNDLRVAEYNQAADGKGALVTKISLPRVDNVFITERIEMSLEQAVQEATEFCAEDYEADHNLDF